MRYFTYFVILTLIVLISLPGCDSNVAPKETIGNYTISGGFVKNLDDSTNLAVISLYRNNTIRPNAIISVSDNDFTYNSTDSTYRFAPDSIDSDSYYLNIYDSITNLNDSVQFVIPGDFYITSTSLPSDSNPGGQAFQIQWSTSLSADGYILAVVKQDSAYLINGFVESVEGATPSTTVPLDAFRPSGVLDPDTGWYNVYIYSFTGSPASDENLPTAIPPIFSNNISHQNLSGSFGTIVVCPVLEIQVVVGN